MASPPRRLPHRLLVMAIAALAALAGPGLATAAPSLVAPVANAAVPVRPTFTWAPGAQDNPVRYQVYVTSATAAGALQAGDNLVAQAQAPTTSAVSGVDLPEGVLLTWFVRSYNASNQSVDTPLANRNTIRVAPPSPTLTLTPAALSATTTPTFSWSGDRATSHWTIYDASGTPVQGGEVAAPSGQATAALASGTFRLEVIQRNLIGAESPPAAAA